MEGEYWQTMNAESSHFFYGKLNPETRVEREAKPTFMGVSCMCQAKDGEERRMILNGSVYYGDDTK